MAALSVTRKTKRLPIGDRFQQTLRATTTAGGAAADEWIPTDLSHIEAVVGVATVGTADAGVNVVPNAQGTGESEDSSPGDLGVEDTAGGVTVEVTVIGRA